MSGRDLTALARFLRWSPDYLATMVACVSVTTRTCYVVACRDAEFGMIRFDGQSAEEMAPLFPRSKLTPSGSLIIHEGELACRSGGVRERVVFCDSIEALEATQRVLDERRVRRAPPAEFNGAPAVAAA